MNAQPSLNAVLYAVLLLHLTDAFRELSGHNILALRFLFVCFSCYRTTIENSSSHVLFSFTPLFVLSHFTVIVLVCLNPWDRIGLGREQDLFTSRLKSWFCDFYGSSTAIFFPDLDRVPIKVSEIQVANTMHYCRTGENLQPEPK